MQIAFFILVFFFSESIEILDARKLLILDFFQVGKGITYDTGGADIKAGGVMAGTV